MAIAGSARVYVFLIKLLRLLFIWMSLRVAARMQEAAYIEAVYGRDEPPPSMTGMLTTIAQFMVLFHAVLLTTVKVLVINKQLGSRTWDLAWQESVVYVLFVLGMAALVGHYVSTKKYFNYKEDGIRAIRAYRDIVILLVLPVALSPLLFSS